MRAMAATANGGSVHVVRRRCSTRLTARRALTSMQAAPTSSASSSSSRVDVVLSSGFLAFAKHTAFLQAVCDRRVQVSGVMGTSAGALTGSLFAAGYTPQQTLEILCELPPYNFLALPDGPWGSLSLRPVVSRLSQLLPATFEELPVEFACGVVRSHGLNTTQYTLVDSGALVEAVVASACIPVLFTPLSIPGKDGRWADGGRHDRVGLRGWRARRRAQSAQSGAECSLPPPALVHVIQRSSQFSGDDDLSRLADEEERALYVQTPKSARSLLDFGDYRAEFDAVRDTVAAQLASADAPSCFHAP